MSINLLTKYETQIYDIVFITNIPAFYKINLYNEINKKKKILVIFISEKSFNRIDDFYKGDKNFEYIYLDSGFYEKRNSKKNSLKLIKVLNSKKYKKIILGGWDSLENWTAWLLSSKKQNAVIVESSEFESTHKGVKGLLKKIFVQKISLGFASGDSQKKLLKNIGYKGEIRKTKGVGIFNYNRVSIKREISEVKKFLYVGRLSEEKNLEQIINIFNKIPNLKLTIVGYGPLEKKLKNIANCNIEFLGKVENKNLSRIYQEHDVFILPSKSEPWGLVVEEALYNGKPVIVSNRVGCHTEIIQENIHGYICNIDEDEELVNKIKLISKIEVYNAIRKNVENIDFEFIKRHQVDSYF